jgi:hypothetical protein
MEIDELTTIMEKAKAIGHEDYISLVQKSVRKADSAIGKQIRVRLNENTQLSGVVISARPFNAVRCNDKAKIIFLIQLRHGVERYTNMVVSDLPGKYSSPAIHKINTI